MIVLASDHAGFYLKEKLKPWLFKNEVQFFDIGAVSYEKLDSYVAYGKKAVDYFLKNCDIKKDKLVLICGSGVGMNIVANRNEKIRAVLANTKKQAVQGRQHNDCNCLCIGARNINFLKAKNIIKTFLQTEFLGEKYLDRINEI